MDTSDYIRKAVELADANFPWDHYRTRTDDYELTQVELDALAAQLRRQVQFGPHIVFNISVVDSASYVEMLIYNPDGDEEAEPLRFVANEIEESMAFAKVIVDSGVLEHG